VAGERVIGVDVGGTKILAGLVDRDGRIERSVERPTPKSSQEDLLAEIDGAVEKLLNSEVAAVGFGLCSTIDQRQGRAVSSVNVPLADLNVRERMAERFSVPVGIDNDANAAAIAEWRIGAGRGTNDMVMLTLGTGVGGGLILGGKPYRGAVGAGGELGHVVLDYHGPSCQGTCPGHGHFETLAGGLAGDAAAHELYGPGADARDLVSRGLEGDGPARTALAEIGRRLGAGIASLVNIFNPEVVVVGGGFASGAGELLLEPAREFVRREALPPARDLVRIVPAALGPDAGMVGAAFVGFEALDER
jgi:glucokinase